MVGSKGATLELAVLGLLHDSPLHGYELRKRLNLLLGWTRLLSYGSLYPALKRMLRAGLVTEVAMASPGVSRRQRIVYQITSAGTEYFGASGTITNIGGTAQDVPPILIVLRDARDRKVYELEVRSPKRTLAPGEAVTVNEAVTDVPRSAKFCPECGAKP